MRKLKYLFTLPEGQKVTEKDMRRVLLSSVISILLCMTCLVSTTWAWYTVSITSENNEIQIGEFAVTVEINGTKAIPNNGTYSLDVGTHEIKITNTGTCSGYCQITLVDNVSQQTVNTTSTISVGGSQTVNVEVAGGPATMTITNHWGESHENGEQTTIAIGEAIEETIAPTEGTSDPTEGASAPTEGTTDPAEETAAPTEGTSDPTETPSDPTEETSAPTVETTAPPENTTAPEQEQ